MTAEGIQDCECPAILPLEPLKSIH
jgi:hypothetical protein